MRFRELGIILNRYYKQLELFSKAGKVFPLVRYSDILRGIKAAHEIQQKMIGRHCGDMGDKLSQYCSIIQFVRARRTLNMDGIEIGTLFGGSCLMKLFAMRHSGVNGKVICIDPMAGFYDNTNDPVTGLGVTPETLFRNLALFSFPKESIDLRQVFSDDAEATAGLGLGRFATLLIDGDHSFEGVIKDWEHYNLFVAKGGYVLFDDYDEPIWPSVTEAVNKILDSLSEEEWRPCGKLGTTFVLQRLA